MLKTCGNDHSKCKALRRHGLFGFSGFGSAAAEGGFGAGSEAGVAARPIRILSSVDLEGNKSDTRVFSKKLSTRTLLVPSNRGIWPQIMGT